MALNLLPTVFFFLAFWKLNRGVLTAKKLTILKTAIYWYRFFLSTSTLDVTLLDILIASLLMH